ncbi:MAG: metallophosphoesterase [Clostridia bacterium]|nr:metallophosphoesterase [Clostridia bacterium]
MRMTYCVSDIHGEYELFLRLLNKINFSDSDRLIVCGDIIDKGKDSVKLAKYIFGMPNAECIAGNHEYEFLKLYWSLMKQSPNDFDALLKRLQNYFPYDGNLLDWDTVDAFDALPYYIKDENFICVHAGVPLDSESKLLSVEKASREQLVYDRVFKDESVAPIGGKCVLFGHTPTSYICGESRILAYKREAAAFGGRNIKDYYKIHLDTGTWLDGVLGCFRIDDCRAFYVNKES